MDKVYFEFLQILKSALCSVSATISDTFDVEKSLSIAKKHGITTMFYYGLLNSGLSVQGQSGQWLFRCACQDVTISERQKLELSRISSAFDENKIDYMPLKGAELKKRYPKPEMRPMGDIDVLVKVSQYPEIKVIMENLGFEECEESNHEYIWRNKNCLIELHKFLIPSYNTDYFSYYGDGWRLANRVAGNQFALSKEDCLIYLFTHFAKHYRDSGIGLRHIIDIWVYITSEPGLNVDYMLGELKKLQLDDFYRNVTRTLENWFCDGPADNITEFITEFIFNNGIYGTKHTHILAMALRDKKNNKGLFAIRIEKVYRSIFVARRRLCKEYPILKRHPILLPVYWAVYLFRRIFFEKSIKTYGKELALLNDEKISKYEEALAFVGLGFHFEEQ